MFNMDGFQTLFAVFLVCLFSYLLGDSIGDKIRDVRIARWNARKAQSEALERVDANSVPDGAAAEQL